MYSGAANGVPDPTEVTLKFDPYTIGLYTQCHTHTHTTGGSRGSHGVLTPLKSVGDL